MKTNNTNTNTNTVKGQKMELSKTAVSLISALTGITITAAVLLASFSYKTGVQDEKIKNIVATVNINKSDFKEDIKGLKETKAEKEIVNLIFEEIKNIRDDFKNSYNKLDSKLDRLIENKLKVSAKKIKYNGEG